MQVLKTMMMSCVFVFVLSQMLFRSRSLKPPGHCKLTWHEFELHYAQIQHGEVQMVFKARGQPNSLHSMHCAHVRRWTPHFTYYRTHSTRTAQRVQRYHLGKLGRVLSSCLLLRAIAASFCGAGDCIRYVSGLRRSQSWNRCGVKYFGA